MGTKVISVEVEGAKEAMQKALLEALKFTEDAQDLTNWGLFVVIVDDYDQPVKFSEGNMTSNGVIAACEVVKLKEAYDLMNIDE